jgi:PhnB protein
LVLGEEAFMAQDQTSVASLPCTIAPWLSVRNGARAVEYYKAALGAVEVFRLDSPDGGVVARLSVHGAEFWLGDESPEHGNLSPESLGGGTVRMVLTVPDPDAVFAQAVAAGGFEVHPVVEEHGWRVGRVRDPFGHHWEIGRPLAEESS